jgi:hypothetical protein
MPKRLTSIVLLLSLSACAVDHAVQGEDDGPKERVVPKAMSEKEEAALLAQHLPPEMIGDPNLSRGEKIQQAIDKQLEQIRQGGESDALKPDAEALVESWSKLGKASVVEFTVEKPSCFKGGCAVVTRHASYENLEPILADLTHTQGFHRWNAGKFRSGLEELKNGQIRVTWVLHAPAEGEPVMQPEEHYENFDETRAGIASDEPVVD